MSERTEIQWADSTFNPWIGCTKVSVGASGGGCDHCYAEVITPVRVMRGKGIETWGPGATRHRTSAGNWRQPLHWNAQPFVECMGCRWRGEARAASFKSRMDGFYPPIEGAKVCPDCGEQLLRESRRRVFCASLADIFDNEVDPAWRADLFALIAATPNLSWLLLTKRIGNAATMIEHARGRDPATDGTPWPFPRTLRGPLANVWLGATVVNQREADRDVPKLLETPAAARFLSIEPMLGPVDLSQWLRGNPAHEIEAERGIRLSGSTVRRPGDSAKRRGVEGAQARLGSMEADGGEPLVQASPSGARLRGIPAGEDHAGRSAGLCTGAPSGLEASEGAHPARSHDQPPGRTEEEQLSRQPGTSDAFGAATSRGAGAESWPHGGAEREPELDGEAHRGGGSSNPAAPAGGGEIDADRRELRHVGSGNLEDLSRRSLGAFWVICGGESGPHARPANPQWFRDIRDQCAAAEIPFLFKQWGAWAPGSNWPDDVAIPSGECCDFGEPSLGDAGNVWRVGKKLAGRLLDGVEHNSFPEVRHG